MAVVSAAVAAIVLIVVIIAAVAGLPSGGGGRVVPAGQLVGTGTLTSGYRLVGKVHARAAHAVTIDITQVEAAAPDARNVILHAGLRQEFDTPATGTVQVARKGRLVSSAAALHVGDMVTLLGQFTSVTVPPAPAHDGYAFFAIEGQ